jgi:hypothetical protein
MLRQLNGKVLQNILEECIGSEIGQILLIYNDTGQMSVLVLGIQEHLARWQVQSNYLSVQIHVVCPWQKELQDPTL